MAALFVGLVGLVGACVAITMLAGFWWGVLSFSIFCVFIGIGETYYD